MYVLLYVANKPLMNSNQQTHQAMQGKYSNYQPASQNNQLVSILFYILYIIIISQLLFYL